jgi:hypothetical protein
LLGVALPYRKYLHDENYKMKNILIFGYVIASYITAFTNENTVPIIILLGGFLILRDLIKKGIKNIPVWLVLSVLSMGVGYSLFIFSPNTKRRTMVYRDMFNLPEKMSLDEVKNNIERVIRSFIDSNYRFIIIFIISIFILCLFYFIKYKKHNQPFINYAKENKHYLFLILNITIWILFIISFINHKYLRVGFSCSILLLSNFVIYVLISRCLENIKLYENIFLSLLSSISIVAMFFVPYTEIRTFFGVQIFLILIVIRINYILLASFPDGMNKYLKYIPNICFCLISIIFLKLLLTWTLDYSQFNSLRSESIRKQVAEGNTTVIAKKYTTEKNKYINTREVWISDNEYGGSLAYLKFHGGNNIVWNMLSYEEGITPLNFIFSISIPRNISDISTYDIITMNWVDDNFVITCGEYDPQVYLLLKEPIKRPSGNPYIEIHYTNSKTGTLQVFYDFGNGLSEADSSRNNIEIISEMSKIRLPIVNWHSGKYLNNIRIDPPDGTIFEIKEINIGEM